MLIPRAVESNLRALARQSPVALVPGARQAGKTTLARMAFPDHHYVSLDLASLAEQAERDTERFFDRRPLPLVIGEVQYAPGLFRHLKRLVDERADARGSFILTGSQKFVLMKEVSESLAGRAGLLELENLSFSDVRSAGLVTRERSPMVGAMARGLFPRLWKDAELTETDFYRSYLEGDVRAILNVANLRHFERFLRIVAARSATVLNKTEIARDAGVSPKAIGDWLSVLEASGTVSFLEPWFSSFGKRIVKSPKIYLNDCGLLCYLLGLQKEDVERSAFVGQVWETFVYSELRKLSVLSSRPVHLWFYRDQRAREIDFMIESGGRIDCLECKWSESPRAEEARTMRAVMSELGASGGQWTPGSTTLISRAQVPHRLEGGADGLIPDRARQAELGIERAGGVVVVGGGVHAGREPE